MLLHTSLQCSPPTKPFRDLYLHFTVQSAVVKPATVCPRLPLTSHRNYDVIDFCMVRVWMLLYQTSRNEGRPAFVDITIDLMCKVPTSVLRSTFISNGIITTHYIYPQLHNFVLSSWYCDEENSFCGSKCGSRPPLCTLLSIRIFSMSTWFASKLAWHFIIMKSTNLNLQGELCTITSQSYQTSYSHFRCEKRLFRLWNGFAIDITGCFKSLAMVLMRQKHLAIMISVLLCREN